MGRKRIISNGIVGWLTPKNEFVEAPLFEHMSVISGDERMQPERVLAVLEDLQETERLCAETAAREGASNAEWHIYEIKSDRASAKIWDILMQEGYLRVCSTEDNTIHFEGRPFAIKDKAQYCKDWAESFGCTADFHPVKKDKS